MNIVNHITHFLKEHLPDYTSKSYLVAVSGGVDSMVLLHALQCLEITISVAHVNYQLRGRDSDLDADLVHNYCKANHIEHFQLNAEMTGKVGVQEEARVLRYSWFQELLEKKRLDVIITAHHLDDQAETILQKLCRGTGLGGASGMRAVNGHVLRPLLEISKAALESHAEANEVPFRTDRSNAKNDYTRNRIRNVVFPELEQINTHAKKHISGFGVIVSQAESLAKAEAKRVWDSNSSTTDSGHLLSLSSWINSHYASLIFHYILEELDVPGIHTSEVFKLSKSNSGKKITTPPYVIWKDRDSLIFERDVPLVNEFKCVINSEGSFDLPQGKITLKTQALETPFILDSNAIYFSLERLTWPLIIRTWKPGDSFLPFGMKGRQKVSDLLIQKKVRMAKKKEVLVLEHRNEIIWVIGIRSSEYTRVSADNSKMLKILLSN